MSATIVEALKKEHEKLRSLFKQIHENKEKIPVSDLKLAFPELQALLLAHSEAEESSLYKPLDEAGELKDEVMEGREEHHIATVLLQEMSAAGIADDVWLAKFEVLRESLEHHLGEEEEEIFPVAEKLFSRQEARELGERYEDRRDDIMRDAPRSA